MHFKTFAYLTILCFLSLVIVCSCDSTENKKSSNQSNTKENSLAKSDTTKKETTTNTEKTDEENYLIEEQSFQKIAIGSKISDAKNIEKGLFQNGEGTFDVYYIKSDLGEKLGFIIPSFKEEAIVGQIVVISPRAKTTKGIQVGMTYGKLETLVGEVEVYGSEIESRTHAEDGTFSYRLDAVNSTYQVDKSKVSKYTKILEIIILTNRD
jgi:hypothetical protein